MTALTVLHVDILLTVMFPSFYVSVSQTKLVIGLTAPVAAPGVYACWGTIGAPLTSVGARWSGSQHWGACAPCMVAHSRKGGTRSLCLLGHNWGTINFCGGTMVWVPALGCLCPVHGRALPQRGSGASARIFFWKFAFNFKSCHLTP